MAATRPRIVFTPDADALQAIDRLAMFRGVPRSKIVEEYMGLISPAIADLAEALALAEAARLEAQEFLRETLDDLHDPVVNDAQQIVFALRGMIARLRDEPPSSNTGVTTSPTPLPLATNQG
jgi:hypothetical protein